MKIGTVVSPRSSGFLQRPFKNQDLIPKNGECLHFKASTLKVYGEETDDMQL